MLAIRSAACALLLLLGLIFMMVSVKGVLTLPDPFCQPHAIALGQSLGMGFCCLGMFIYQGPNITGLKILMVLFVSMLAGPIGTHIVDRVAFREGIKKEEKDAERREG